MTKSVSQSGPRSAPNTIARDNPYEDEFGILPLSEMQRILNKIRRRGVTGRVRGNVLTMTDVQREARLVCHRPLQFISDGKPLAGLPYNVRPVRTPLRRLSQFLIRFERGLVVKRGGKVVYLDEPEEGKKPDMVYRVSLAEDSRGNIRPTIVRAPPLPQVHQMPKLFTQFKLPGAK